MSAMRLKGRISKIISQAEVLVSIISYSYQGQLFNEIVCPLENLIVDANDMLKDELTDVMKFCKVDDNLVLDCKIHKNIGLDNNYEIEVVSATILNIQEPKIVHGLENHVGVIRYLSVNDGYLISNDEENDEQYKIYFPFMNVHLSNHIVANITDLREVLTEEMIVYFDAVPILPNFNPYKCDYFATAIWIDLKPDYKTPFRQSMRLLEEILIASSDPQACFLHSYGTILSINEQNSGFVCGQIAKNHWITIIFLNSSVSCANVQCSCDSSLHYIVKKGDKVEFLAVKLYRVESTEWAAIKMCTYDNDSV